MDNIILWPLIIGVAVCAYIIFGRLRKRNDKPTEDRTRKGGGSGDGP